MTSLLVVRHAQSVWNLEGRWQGHADPPLSAEGAAQARAAAAALTGVERIVTSDLVRARATAEIIAETLDTRPVIVDARWRERDIGLWQGLTTQEIHAQYPGDLAVGEYPPGWEGDESLSSRALEAINALAEGADGGEVLVVTHAGVIYSLERYFGHSFERIGNLGGRRILAQRGEVRFAERIALTDHGACLRPAAMTERL